MALENDNELREFIRKAALLNAVSHDGKAQAGAMVGKILGEKAELRSRVKGAFRRNKCGCWMKLTVYQSLNRRQL